MTQHKKSIAVCKRKYPCLTFQLLCYRLNVLMYEAHLNVSFLIQFSDPLQVSVESNFVTLFQEKVHGSSWHLNVIRFHLQYLQLLQQLL